MSPNGMTHQAQQFRENWKSKFERKIKDFQFRTEIERGRERGGESVTCGVGCSEASQRQTTVASHPDKHLIG